MAPGDDAPSEDDNFPSPCVVNPQYVAFVQHGEVCVQPVSSRQQPAITLHRNIRDDPRRIVLAFSPIRHNVLAVADGTQVLVYDVESSKAALTLRGNGRTISALAFDETNDDAIATGCIDGSICVWSMTRPRRPLRQLRGITGVCKRIAFASGRSSLLASLHGSTVPIWNSKTGRPICLANVKVDAALLAWHPSDAQSVLVLSRRGDMHIVRPPDLLAYSSSDSIQDDFDEEDTFSKVQSIGVMTSQVTVSVRQAYLLGHLGIIVLPPASTILYFYSCNAEDRKPTELWRLRVNFVIDCFVVQTHQDTVEIVVCSPATTRSWTIPPSVLDGMGFSPSSVESIKKRSPRDVKSKGDAQSRMCPRTAVRISHHSRKQSWRPRNALKPLSRKTSLHHSSINQTSKLDTHKSPSMHSSLELPEPRAKPDRSSPIPFLSPSIPARRPSSGSLPPLDEMTKREPGATPETLSLVAAEGHESDSDDDTFAEHMQDSASFLPGGLNVPLPRTCGAQFSSSGQLLTFFPSRMESEPMVMDAPLDALRLTESGTPSGGSGLFPSFGNLSMRSRVDPPRTCDSIVQAAGSLKDCSFDSQLSWTARTSPVKQTPGLPGTQHRVKISIYEMERLTPTRKALSTRYRFMDQTEHMPFMRCRQNAVLAMNEGLHEAAEAWESFALTLEHPVLDFSAKYEADRPFNTLCEDIDSGLVSGFSVSASSGMLNAGTIASGWTVSSLFARIEERADVQLLACMSTFLAVALDGQACPRPDTSTSNQLAEIDSAIANAAGSFHALSARHTALSTERQSTIKISRSHESSRNTSQPTTPYVDSASSTPPLAFTSGLRQGAGPSPSGSASPERARTSFSIAAKNYAVSIVEKFNSYGVSPPPPRTGTSPGNELSSSLPTTSGSWSKSVSFASTSGPSRPRQHSLSLAQEDDEYDSDKTVEDNSLPLTPRSMIATTIWKEKGDNISVNTGCTHANPALLLELANKCQIWRECYAEHLRSWDLVQEAAELTQDPQPNTDVAADASMINDAVLPTCSGNKRPLCSICYCLISTSMQVCPSCLHTTHPRCLEKILLACQDTEFSCPTGCGCDCTSTADVHYDLDQDPQIVQERPPAAVKRRRSLTDPLRLRQKLQGDSW